VVNRPLNTSDENMFIIVGLKSYSIRAHLIQFPLVVHATRIQLRYTRSYGDAAVVLLLMYQSRELFMPCTFMNVCTAEATYIDRFVHIVNSELSGNQYALSTQHYSNFTHTQDGAVLLRSDKVGRMGEQG
jgi:hypothetical protein